MTADDLIHLHPFTDLPICIIASMQTAWVRVGPFLVQEGYATTQQIYWDGHLVYAPS